MTVDPEVKPAASNDPAIFGDTPLSAVIRLFPGTFFVADPAGHCLLWNSRFEQLTGLTPEMLRQTWLPDLFDEADRPRIHDMMTRLFEHDEEALLEAAIACPGGQRLTYLLASARIHCQQLPYLCSVGIDTTDRHQQDKLLRLRERALHAASNGIVITRCAGHDNPIEYVNPAFERITGYTAEEALGRDSRFMAAPGLDEDERAQLREAICERREINVIFRNLRKDGTLFWNELTITPVLDERGAATHFIGIINDVTAVKQRTSHLEHRVNHDPLTGLANRNLLWDRLEQAIHTAQRNKTLVAVVLVDLNKFKLINDTYGHPAGDVVLTSVARRMQAAVRDTDTVARLSGDEFVLVLVNQPSLRYTLRMLDRLRNALLQPVTLNSSEIHVGASLGVSVYPHDGDAPVELVKAADTAMYHAKSAGKGDVYFYSADMKSSSDAKRQQEAEMRSAVENGEFFLLYQPRLGVHSGRCEAVEALLRWRHPARGLLLPAAFLYEAEENGMVHSIGAHVMREVLNFMADLRDHGYGQLPVSINAGYHEFSQQNYVSNLQRRLSERGLDGCSLQLELSEHHLMRNPQLTRVITRQLRDAGIGLSIDHFGDGLTSLSSLREMTASHLKLNPMAVHAISPDGDRGMQARLLIDIGHNLGLHVVGASVETEEQATFLSEHGCDELQGSYCSPPLAASGVKQLLGAPPA